MCGGWMSSVSLEWPILHLDDEKPKMHALGNFSSPKGLNGFLAWILSLLYALINAILNVDSRPF